MTAPTPERPLDVEALRRLADEYAGPDLEEVAAEEFELRVGEAVAPMLPAILAALTELEGLRAEVARGPSEVLHMRELLNLQMELEELRAEVRAYCGMLATVGIGPPDADGGFPRMAQACAPRGPAGPALAAHEAEEVRGG